MAMIALVNGEVANLWRVPCHKASTRDAAVPEVRRPVGHHVIETTADQAKRRRPDGDVEDSALLSAAGNPATVIPHDRDDDDLSQYPSMESGRRAIGS
ncbi:hypothetical protein AZG88_35680 [Rhodococcus sp. LB1]|nr:hypothetical protein AZG88_35680 [Rhodococcus sp. LB1]